jgi:hypothetical protein
MPPIVRWLVGVEVSVVALSTLLSLPLEHFLLGLRLTTVQYALGK